MPRLGPNASGERLEPGWVSDCYLAILLDQSLAEIAPETGSVPVVVPGRAAARRDPQPDGLG